LLTCKQFLQDLNEFLDETLDPNMKAELQRHVNECPNCWVVCDTTLKTLKVFKGLDPKPIPEHVHAKLMQALERRIKAKGKGSCEEGPPVDA
jgi:hypothetical protein